MKRDLIAETMWRAEYTRATGKERSIPWSEVAYDDQQKYLYVADVVAAVLSALESGDWRLIDRVDELADALQRIVSWSEAYPLDIFPEPDFKKAHEVLKANGMTIDAISASAARHVVEGVGQIARAALKEKP